MASSVPLVSRQQLLGMDPSPGLPWQGFRPSPRRGCTVGRPEATFTAGLPDHKAKAAPCQVLLTAPTLQGHSQGSTTRLCLLGQEEGCVQRCLA